jgi:transposase
MWTADARQRYAWAGRREELRLINQGWAFLKLLLADTAIRGWPWKHALCMALDAILHLLRTGCAWSVLPDWTTIQPRRSTGAGVTSSLIDSTICPLCMLPTERCRAAEPTLIRSTPFGCYFPRPVSSMP